MITISFVRHGESTDNLKAIWAGWKDAPLSNHGIKQAKACGQTFSNYRLASIYSSPLSRAHTTAKAIYDAQADPRPPFIVSPDLREQHFGVAEGEPWTYDSEAQIDLERKVFPVLNGESLNDLELRVNRALEDLIMPWVYSDKSYGKGEGEVHLAVVSHGLCISELISALVKMDANGYGQGEDYRGLVNTAWTRVTVCLKGEEATHTPHALDKNAPLVIRVTQVNQHEHLAGIHTTRNRRISENSSAVVRPNIRSA
ncbi:histidine phosphatase superfamily [Gautieria morchelliformis]|nr:histidine phosphatase superfamily [Gautieria morchelliformis]